MTAKCHAVNFAGYWFENNAEDAQTHWAEHPEDECPIYNPTRGLPNYGLNLNSRRNLMSLLEDGPCDCPYCHKHLSDCRCDYT